MNLSCHGCANRAVRSDRCCWTFSYRRMLHQHSHGSQRPWHSITLNQATPPWNRLVKLVDGANTVSEYEYDGAKRRTIQKSYASGVLDETRQLYYTDPSKWQVIEERVDSSTDSEQQHIWGLRYIDDCILRDRDTTGNGTLDERLYGIQDANWNVTAISNTNGTVQERYAYSAYGTPVFLSASFGSRSSSSYDWRVLYAGYRWETGTELLHVRNRAYASPLGTWLQRDPLGLHAGISLYQSVTSSPLNFTDPSGNYAIPLPPPAPITPIIPLITACLAFPPCAIALVGTVAIGACMLIPACRASMENLIRSILKVCAGAITATIFYCEIHIRNDDGSCIYFCPDFDDYIKVTDWQGSDFDCPDVFGFDSGDIPDDLPTPI
ncbi:tRNA3(Ser)-specific nuclease WapA precursor [Thalassoglobus polymorphus]|uniref:tRNA3(Ser)-specific nuclease WapA n=1 Tax=Thalassoglobus polymorphus TaxID=2527994 RepID=A0A517QU78_9PLAN|nr:tRNA3(Ser)-specific nuclease WapA precursor [Thalassoglobus polymorphus]